MIVTAWSAAILAAKPGDTLTLSGPFGDFVVSSRSFSPAINLVSDPANPASFRTLTIKNCVGVHAQGLSIAFTPDDKSVAWTAAVTVTGSSDVVLDGLKVIGAPSVNGVVESATALDSTGNVIGRPCGYGVNISASHDVQLVNSEVAQFHRLVVLSNVQRTRLSRNDFHDRRTTAIAGANLTDVTIDDNTIRASNPWRWGQTPVGDHADCLAFWSDAKQTTPNARVRIINNRMEQTSGATILGMWFQGTAAAPFTDFDISDNIFLLPNLQGIALWDSINGRIARNVLIQTQVSGMTDEQRTKQRPTILLRAGVSGVATTDNITSAPISDTSGGQNRQSGNVLLSGSVIGPNP